MSIIFSICIPTYNRAEFLKECLDSVLCQVKNKREVEVIVIDNASPDDTQTVVGEFIKSYDCLKYYRNERNLGLAGNQIKCIEYATGDYVTLLGDDDIYLDGQIDRILKVVSEREYAVVALNYYSFLKNKNKPYKSNFAPVKDVTFQRTYDIMNYPSVGHSSGFIFNAALAKETLNQILAKKSHEDFEKIFGIIGDVSTRSTTASNLPAYFIGYRGLANRIPKTVNYSSLYNLCIYYYKLYLGFYNEGLINKDDLDYRARLVIDTLPRAIISNGSSIDDNEIENITLQLSHWFKGNNKFDNICMPLLHSLQYQSVKHIYEITVNCYRFVKSICYCIKA
jgi:glycosyltransferase involved in cell wall biosynthesis